MLLKHIQQIDKLTGKWF